MLEEVYNIILNIPDTIVFSIPSLKSPSVLVELKRMRQKIKNKIKIGKTRLMNDNSKPTTSSSNNDLYNHENKSKIFLNGFNTSTDFQHEKQTFNSPKYGSTDNSGLNTSYNHTNVFNNSNSNKWFDSRSDFQNNTNTDIYSRERLSVNELGCIVNDNNFDSYSISDLQSCSVNDNNSNTFNNFETKKVSSQSSCEKGNKLRMVIFLNKFINSNLFFF